MYKTLCVAVLLLPTFALAQGVSPQIVARAKLTHQTATIPTTTIYTPTQTGLYRLSIYATVSKSDPNSGSNWIVGVWYTDDSGQQQPLGGLLEGYNSVPGMFTIQNFLTSLGGPTVTFNAKAGTPVTYSVTENGPPDNSAYSLYYTLERLE